MIRQRLIQTARSEVRKHGHIHRTFFPGIFLISLVMEDLADSIFALDLKLDDKEMNDERLESLDRECVVFSIKYLPAEMANKEGYRMHSVLYVIMD